MMSKKRFALSRLRSALGAPTRATRPSMSTEAVHRSANQILHDVADEVRSQLPVEHPWHMTTGTFRYEYFLKHICPEREKATLLNEQVMAPLVKERSDAELVSLDLLTRSAGGAFCYRMAEDQLSQAYDVVSSPDDLLDALRTTWQPVRRSMLSAFQADTPFGNGVSSSISAVDALLSDELSMQLPRTIHLQFIREDLQARVRIFTVSFQRKAQAFRTDLDLHSLTEMAHRQRMLNDIATGEAALELVWHRLFHAALRPNEIEADNTFVRATAIPLRKLLLRDADSSPKHLLKPAFDPHIDGALHVESLAGSGLTAFPWWPMPERFEWIDELHSSGILRTS